MSATPHTTRDSARAVEETAAGETVYTADSQLRAPGRFASGVWSDVRVAPMAAWRLFAHGLRASYRQSWLGYLWLPLPALATTLTWVYLNRAGVLAVGETGLPYPVYVLAGTLLWQVFAEALQSPLQQLTGARRILTKSRLPHEALLMAGVVEVLFNFAVRLAVLVPVLVWFGAGAGWTLVLAPLGVAALLVLGFALGLLLTPLGLLYQDVARGLVLVSSFWFFLTPVIYPPPPSWPASLTTTVNPVAPLLVTTRGWLTGGAAAPAAGFAVVVVLSVMLLAAGWLLYRLARPHLVARL